MRSDNGTNKLMKPVGRVGNILMLAWLIYAYVCFKQLLQYGLLDYEMSAGAARVLLGRVDVLINVWSCVGMLSVAFALLGRWGVWPYAVYSAVLVGGVLVFLGVSDDMMASIDMCVCANGRPPGELRHMLEHSLNRSIYGYAIVGLVFSAAQTVLTVCSGRLSAEHRGHALRAFSLPEMLVVLVIIGILVLIALPNLMPLYL